MSTGGCLRLAGGLVLGAVGWAASGAAPALANGNGNGHGPGNGHANGTGHAKGNFKRFVYTQTNEPSANNVVAFRRGADGKLTQAQEIATGGKGTAMQQPFGLPNVDSANSVTLTPNGKLLFVVNSGDNTITSFRVTRSGLQRADRESSGGILPVSVAVHGKVLYVLNGMSGNVFGYRVSSKGKLKQIPDSSQSLSVVGPNGIAAGLGFTPDGRWLIATLRYLPLQDSTDGQNGIIDRFRIAGNGSPSPVVGTTAATPTPFGFDFTPNGILVTSVAGVVKTVNNEAPPVTDGSQINGSAQSYAISSTGELTPISNAEANGRATCWLVVTRDGKWAFATNTLSAKSDNPVPGNPIGTGKDGIAQFSVGADGSLTRVGNTDAGPGFPSDIALSHDQRYLYVDNASLGLIGDAVSHVGVYKVGSDGSLTLIQSTPMNLPQGTSGMAAY